MLDSADGLFCRMVYQGVADLYRRVSLLLFCCLFVVLCFFWFVFFIWYYRSLRSVHSRMACLLCFSFPPFVPQKSLICYLQACVNVLFLLRFLPLNVIPTVQIKDETTKMLLKERSNLILISYSAVFNVLLGS